jgi:hypothetical protein
MIGLGKSKIDLCCLFIVLILILTYINLGLAESWFASIDTWKINRQSETIGMDILGSVSGQVSAINVTPQGKIVSGYHARYSHISLNNVILETRTNARQGSLESKDAVYLRSAAIEDITRNITKVYESPMHIFEFQEVWPVILRSSSSLSYEGLEINDRDLAWNDLDYAGNENLYSEQLYKIRICDLELKRLNVTVTASEGGVEQVEFLPTKSIQYLVDTDFTGVGTLRYRQVAPDQVTVLNGNEEAFYGRYHITSQAKMGLDHLRIIGEEETGLNCCNK